jgi:glutathione S-transferase
MRDLKLVVLSLRYSSWSIRPWLALRHANAAFRIETAELPSLKRQTTSGAAMQALSDDGELAYRRTTGSITGLYPVLWVDGEPIHESLAICEWAAEAFPEAKLWPRDVMRRARARAISCEMVSGFAAIRSELSCHVFGRAPGFRPSPEADRQIRRVFDLWSDSLERSGGPYLFGHFTIADCMYFPMLTRFRTYGVSIPGSLQPYADTLWNDERVKRLLEVARTAPPLPAYDEYLESIGGDPTALL